jgi:ABC-type dipeptide/oligopeptide/nickel transport system permease component
MILLILGWIGTLMVIGAYALVVTHHLEGDSWLARVLNLLGSVCIAIPAAIAGLWNVVALQAVWFGITLYAILRPRPKLSP